MVDWRAADNEIGDAFFKAAGITGAQIRYEDAPDPVLIHQGEKLQLKFADSVSRQYSVVKALHSYFGIRHAIRYLNHAAAGDTAYFVVEAASTWARLETENPHVKFFFTPFELLPDFIESPFDEIAEVGKRYADARRN